MRTHQLSILLIMASLAGAAPFSKTASADIELSVQGAGAFGSSNYSFVNNPNLLLGAQATLGMTPLFQLGAAYQNTFLRYTDSTSGNLKFYGALVHVCTFTGVFADGQAGVSFRDTSSNSFSWGVGAGYAIPLNYFFDLSPRIGYRYVPDSGTARSMVDAGLLLTLKIL